MVREVTNQKENKVKVKYKGKFYELDSNILKEIAGINRDSARRRINRYERGEITYEQLMATKEQSENSKVKVYRRGSKSLTVYKLIDIVGDITNSAASKRLRQWIEGKITYEQLTSRAHGYTRSPTRGHGSKEWQMLGDRERTSPLSLPITQFEIEYGEKKERSWGYVDAGY